MKSSSSINRNFLYLELLVEITQVGAQTPEKTLLTLVTIGPPSKFVV